MRSRLVVVALLGPATLAMLGFGLDRGELTCERAAVQLHACCVEIDVRAIDCEQAGGCDRRVDGTILTEVESDCVESASCADITSRRVCERLVERAEALEQPEPPTLEALQAGDPLCD